MGARALESAPQTLQSAEVLGIGFSIDYRGQDEFRTTLVFSYADFHRPTEATLPLFDNLSTEYGLPPLRTQKDFKPFIEACLYNENGEPLHNNADVMLLFPQTPEDRKRIKRILTDRSYAMPPTETDRCSAIVEVALSPDLDAKGNQRVDDDGNLKLIHKELLHLHQPRGNRAKGTLAAAALTNDLLAEVEHGYYENDLSIRGASPVETAHLIAQHVVTRRQETRMKAEAIDRVRESVPEGEKAIESLIPEAVIANVLQASLLLATDRQMDSETRKILQELVRYALNNSPDPRHMTPGEIQANRQTDKEIARRLRADEMIGTVSGEQITAALLLTRGATFTSEQKKMVAEKLQSLATKTGAISVIEHEPTLQYTILQQGEGISLSYSELLQIIAIDMTFQIQEKTTLSAEEQQIANIAKALQAVGFTLSNFRSDTNPWVQENQFILPEGASLQSFEQALNTGNAELLSTFRAADAHNRPADQLGIHGVIDEDGKMALCEGHSEEVIQKTEQASETISRLRTEAGQAVQAETAHKTRERVQVANVLAPLSLFDHHNVLSVSTTGTKRLPRDFHLSQTVGGTGIGYSTDTPSAPHQRTNILTASFGGAFAAHASSAHNHTTASQDAHTMHAAPDTHATTPNEVPGLINHAGGHEVAIARTQQAAETATPLTREIKKQIRKATLVLQASRGRTVASSGPKTTNQTEAAWTQYVANVQASKQTVPQRIEVKPSVSITRSTTVKPEGVKRSSARSTRTNAEPRYTTSHQPVHFERMTPVRRSLKSSSASMVKTHEQPKSKTVSPAKAYNQTNSIERVFTRLKSTYQPQITSPMTPHTIETYRQFFVVPTKPRRRTVSPVHARIFSPNLTPVSTPRFDRVSSARPTRRITRPMTYSTIHNPTQSPLSPDRPEQPTPSPGMLSDASSTSIQSQATAPAADSINIGSTIAQALEETFTTTTTHKTEAASRAVGTERTTHTTQEPAQNHAGAPHGATASEDTSEMTRAVDASATAHQERNAETTTRVRKLKTKTGERFVVETARNAAKRIVQATKKPQTQELETPEEVREQGTNEQHAPVTTPAQVTQMTKTSRTVSAKQPEPTMQVRVSGRQTIGSIAIQAGTIDTGNTVGSRFAVERMLKEIKSEQSFAYAS